MIGRAAMNIAGTQVGVREATGHNDGTAVEGYLASVGLGKGYSWCMAFVYWCVKQAALAAGIPNPLEQTGGVLEEWNSGRGQHIEKHSIQAGDIGILDLGSGHGHTFFITGAWPEQDLIHTIEGNTNDDGSADGIGVFRRQRRISDPHFVGAIRI